MGRRFVEIHSGDGDPADDHSFDLVGSFTEVIERPHYVDQMIWLNASESCGFSGVPLDVWNLEIGGYKVCEKWLKDRKDRKLSKADRSKFLTVLSTLSETLKLQDQLDGIVRSNGGWNKTFVEPST